MQSAIYIALVVVGLGLVIAGVLIIAFPGRPERNSEAWATRDRAKGRDPQSDVEDAFRAGPFGGAK